MASPPGVLLPVLGRVLPSGRSLAVAFGLLAAALGAYAAARGTSLFSVDAVEVRGGSPAVTRRVEQALAPLAGRSLLSIDSGEVDRALAGLPDVHAVEVDRAFPRTLRVTVSAERPVAVLRQGSDAWLVSERGRVLHAIRGTPPRTLPRIWVAHVATPADGTVLGEDKVLRPALTLGAVLGAERGFLARVREARAGEEGVTLVLRAGIEVRLGSAEDIPLKLAVTERILTALPGASGGYVDVSVAERAVARVQSQVSS